MNNQQYLKELDYLKGVSILGVVAIHTSVYALIGTRQADFTGFYSIVFNQLARFCVPVFLMISAILFFRSYKPDSFSYSNYISKRVKDLLIPFAVWTAVSIYFLPLKEAYSIRGVIESIFLGIGFFYPLYYIPMLLQLMLFVLPAAIALYKRPSALKAVTCAIVVINLSLLAVYEFVYLRSVQMGPAVAYAYYRYTQPTFFVWSGYFMLGCVIGIHYDYFRNKIQKIKITYLCLFLLASTAYLLWDYSLSLEVFKRFLNPGENFFRVSVFTYSIAAFLFFFKIALSHGRSKFMPILGKYSFGIYLVHIPLLEIMLRKAPVKMFEGWIMVTVSFLLCTGLSMLVAFLLSKVPGGWIIIGPLKKRGNVPALKPDYTNGLDLK